MRNRNVLFPPLYLLNNTLFVLMIVRICISVQCTQRWDRASWLLLAFLGCLYAVQAMAGSNKVPLFSSHCWNLEEMREYMKKQSYLDFVLRNLAYSLWVVLLVELCLTYRGMIPVQPVVYAVLLVGIFFLAAILGLRRRAAQADSR